MSADAEEPTPSAAGFARRRVRSPLWELSVARLREFLREPEAVFWVYGFPVLMMFGLGIAFRNQPPTPVVVDVEQGPAAAG